MSRKTTETLMFISVYEISTAPYSEMQKSWSLEAFPAVDRQNRAKQSLPSPDPVIRNSPGSFSPKISNWLATKLDLKSNKSLTQTFIPEPRTLHNLEKTDRYDWYKPKQRENSIKMTQNVSVKICGQLDIWLKYVKPTQRRIHKFDRGRQRISLVVIYRKCTQRIVCLLYGNKNSEPSGGRRTSAFESSTEPTWQRRLQFSRHLSRLSLSLSLSLSLCVCVDAMKIGSVGLRLLGCIVMNTCRLFD